MCTEDGVCFDILNIVPFVRQHHAHPLTGEPLELKQLIRLNFHKNSEGEYACPVLNKARVVSARRLLPVACTPESGTHTPHFVSRRSRTPHILSP